MDVEERRSRIALPGKLGEVSTLLVRPPEARWLLVLAHGAGAGMEHVFLRGIAGQLTKVGIASLRFQFPYMEAGRRRPDPRPALLATVRAATDSAARHAADLPPLAGGKSMGGRMASLAAAEALLAGVHGLVFLGFPLHPAGRPSTERADHLDAVRLPMLFLQGERDKLADLDLLRPICAQGRDRMTLHVVPDADHGFHVPRRSGRTDQQVLEDLARTTRSWAARLA